MQFGIRLDPKGERPIISMGSQEYLLGPAEAAQLLKVATMAVACFRQPRQPRQWFGTYLDGLREQAQLVRKVVDAIIPPRPSH